MSDDNASARPSSADLNLGIFSFAHRVDHGDHGCNRLHGHTYALAVKVHSRTKQDSETALSDMHNIAKEISSSLDRRVLLASGGDNVYKDDSIMLEYVGADNKRYAFPITDTMLIPLEQITAETLANWIAVRIAEKLKDYPSYKQVETIEVTLSEDRVKRASFTVTVKDFSRTWPD